MLVDDLRATASGKSNGEAVKRSDLALALDPSRQEDGNFNSVIVNVSEEQVLKC